MNIIRRLAGVILLIAGAFLGALWWQRAGLPYNEEGRYFDGATGVVYQEQSVVVFAVLALGLFVIGALLIFAGGKAWRK